MFLLFVLPVLVGTYFAIITGFIFFGRISAIFGIIVELAWIYCVSNFIAEKYSDKVEVPINRLNSALSMLILINFPFFFFPLPTNIMGAIAAASLVLNLYCIYFLARLVVMVEKQRNVGLNDYLMTGIIAYFWLIGIWFLQPRINRIYYQSD